MIVAELEVYHSRPIAPTRRVGLGHIDLPVGPGPGPGGVLLAGVVAQTVPNINAEDRESLFNVCELIGFNQRVNQPSARHRYQDDLVGLTSSRQLLVHENGVFSYEFDNSTASPIQLALGALYAVERISAENRPSVIDAIRYAMVWEGDPNTQFISSVLSEHKLSGEQLERLGSWSDPVAWALDKLGIAEPIEQVSKRIVQTNFRGLIRQAHPDNGGVETLASERVKDLMDAKDILLSKL